MRILYVHNALTTFVRTDLEILSERHELVEKYVKRRTPRLTRLTHNIRECDLVFVWFASWHALAPLLLARSFGKPSILVVGGYDVACMPKISYGHQRGGLKKWVSRSTMRLATKLITFSRYSRSEAVYNAGVDPSKIEVIYLGVNPRLFEFGEEKERMAISTGNVYWENLARKGLEPFVQAAHHLTDVPFALIGQWHDEGAVDHLRHLAPKNVTLAGYVSDQELATYFKRASVYVQASAHEGFGLAVAEAMLAGCMPVVTRAGSLPEVVGDAGIYTEPTPDALGEAILKAFEAGDEARRRGRERILREFPLEKRANALSQLIAETI